MNDDGKVHTIWGAFNRQRADDLRRTLAQASGDTTTFDNHPLDVRFGKYLLEYVDGELGVKA